MSFVLVSFFVQLIFIEKKIIKNSSPVSTTAAPSQCFMAGKNRWKKSSLKPKGEFSAMEFIEGEYSAGVLFGHLYVNVDGLLVLGGCLI